MRMAKTLKVHWALQGIATFCKLFEAPGTMAVTIMVDGLRVHLPVQTVFAGAELNCNDCHSLPYCNILAVCKNDQFCDFALIHMIGERK